MTESFEGWRVWTVRPCTEREKLPNALIFDAPPLGWPHELTQWQSRTLTSKCPDPQRHSESCFCGVHVVENVVDVLYRATHTFRCIGEWVPLAEMPAIVVRPRRVGGCSAVHVVHHKRGVGSGVAR